MTKVMWTWLAGYAVMTALLLGWRVLMVTGGRSRARVTRKAGAATLRPPRGRNFMFAGLALAPTLVLLGVLFKIGRGRGEGDLGLALAFSLLAFGGWLVLWLMAAEFRQHLTVDASTIERVFVVTTLRVKWSEVERITWNPASRWFFIVAAGAWLWVPVEFDGIADFAELALGSLPPAVLQQSHEVRHELEALARLPAPPPSPRG